MAATACHAHARLGCRVPRLRLAATTALAPARPACRRARLHQAPLFALQHCKDARRGIPPVRAAASAGGALPAGAAPGSDSSLFIRKVAGLALIFLGGTVNYTILQSLRDALVVTSCGAEALPLISAFGVLPASLLFFLYHDRLVSNVQPAHVFYWSLAPMAAFFALFAGLLLPNAAAIHPTALCEQWATRLPDSLGCFVRVVANWSTTAFFIVGELWGSVAISLLFWSLADDVCSVEEAREVYPKLGILANVGLIAAGWWTRFVSERLAAANEVLALQILVGSVLITTGFMCGVKALMDARVMPALAQTAQAAGRGGGKRRKGAKASAPAGGGEAGAKKPSSLDVIKSSPRIRDLALLVMCYGVCHKLFGFVWKSEMRRMYPSPTAYATVQGDVAALTGAATIALMAGSKYIFKGLGWRGAALVTPLVCLGSGALFLTGSLMPPGTLPAGSPLAALLSLAPAAGIMAQVFGRASKYSLADPSKEMCFITMDKEEKEKGKAAVDVLGNQIGKSGGSWLMQGALLGFGSMAAALPFTAAAYVGVCVLWLRATLSLASTMESEEAQASVMASIDAAPGLEPPAPGKVRVLVLPPLPPLPAEAATNGGPEAPAPEYAMAMATARQAKEDKEAKSVLQSHFD